MCISQTWETIPVAFRRLQMMKIVQIAIFGLLLNPWVVAFAYEEIEVKDGGTMSGRVTFSGTPPDIPAIRVVKNPEFCGQAVWDPVLVVNRSNSGLKNTVVYLEDINRGKPLPASTTIDVFKCLFVPHATVVFKNRLVVFHNNDTVFHNAHVFREQGGTLFNIALPEMGQIVQKRIKGNGVIHIQCDNHAHMNGWAISLDHPYFSVTDDKGRFRISDVPSGKYKLVAWHEGYIMTNRSAYEASLKSGQGQLERPVYDAPYRIIRSVEVKASSEMRVDFVLNGR